MSVICWRGYPCLNVMLYQDPLPLNRMTDTCENITFQYGRGRMQSVQSATFSEKLFGRPKGGLTETPPRFVNAYLWSLSMLLYNTRTRRTCSIPSFVLIVCRSRSSLFYWNWAVFLVVSFSQCHQYKDVSKRPSEPLPIHILCDQSYILCNNRNITVYVKVAYLSLSPTLSWKIMFFVILYQPTRPLRAFFCNLDRILYSVEFPSVLK